MPPLPLVLAVTLLALPTGPVPSPPETLSFERLIRAGSPLPSIAPEVTALAGKRVRLVGHMVRMELPPRSAFYLAPRPLEADESGGGTSDLPPAAVRIEVPWIEGEVPRVDGPIEVTGTLQVGRVEDREGRVSWLRIVLDPPDDPSVPSVPSAPTAPSSPHAGGPRP
jgi:hypothetical protein